MIAVRLSKEIEDRLEALAKATGRTKTFYVREAVLELLEDLEDYYIAEERMRTFQEGKDQLYTLEEAERILELDR